MSRSAWAFSRRTASGSNSRSIRVFALVACSSVREYTILSAACQTVAKSRTNPGSPANAVASSQYTITSYIRRPRRYVPMGRCRSLTKRCTSSSGTPQSKSPCSSATYPSSVVIME